MGFCLEVSGDYACFTRPEMKVERVSYDVMTPSAARAIYEAILWKPAMQWHITKIDVMQPIRWISLRRNELGSVLSVNNIKKAMNGKGGVLANYIEEDRQQRAALFLRDVRYRIHASFSLTGKAGAEDNAGKFAEMFQRRAKKGQCVNQPYLGCREFACDFSLIDPKTDTGKAIDVNNDLGWMLYDMDYAKLSPLFFRATLTHGEMHVPSKDSDEVRG